MRPTVLVVDDERPSRVLIEEALSAAGFEVRTASTLQRARVELDRATPDLMILDRRLPDGDGIALLRELDEQGQSASLVIVVTAHGDVENAVEARCAGAVDYLTRPFQVTDLVVKLRRMLEARGLRDRLALAASSSDAQRPLVAPKSPASQDVLRKLERVSHSPLTPVLLVGPSGAGKQHAAELLHRMTFPTGTGDGAPFVEVNCAALPAHLVESELFGHERGAFTDARVMRRGLIEVADGGTLFLDEITELPEPSQAKLLKLLDSMRFRRLGGQREIEVSLRIVAATSRDPRTLADSHLREDLYHRLAVFLVDIPPLAERREDIAELARGFMSYFAGRVKKRITGISPGALEALSSYDFPGNVRELRNIVERAMILTAGPEIEARDIILAEAGEPRMKRREKLEDTFFSMALGVDGVPPPAEVVERAYVARVLEHFQGKRVVAAQALGISYPTFLKRLRELGFANDA